MDVELIRKHLRPGISEPVMEILLCQRAETVISPLSGAPQTRTFGQEHRLTEAPSRDGQALLGFPRQWASMTFLPVSLLGAPVALSSLGSWCLPGMGGEAHSCSPSI